MEQGQDALGEPLLRDPRLAGEREAEAINLRFRPEVPTATHNLLTDHAVPEDARISNERAFVRFPQQVQPDTQEDARLRPPQSMNHETAPESRQQSITTPIF